MINEVEYVRENIEKMSRKEIRDYLGISPQTLSKLMRDNDIIDNRIYRYCPICNDKIYYNDIQSRIKIENIKCNCRKCDKLIRIDRSKGENNPFYGKHHSEETKNFCT